MLPSRRGPFSGWSGEGMCSSPRIAYGSRYLKGNDQVFQDKEGEGCVVEAEERLWENR